MKFIQQKLRAQHTDKQIKQFQLVFSDHTRQVTSPIASIAIAAIA